MARRNVPQIYFDDQLVLFRYFLHELKLSSLDELGKVLNTIDYEGINESGNTYFYEHISHVCRMRNANVSQGKLRLYDENICRHTRQCQIFCVFELLDGVVARFLSAITQNL